MTETKPTPSHTPVAPDVVPTPPTTLRDPFMIVGYGRSGTARLGRFLNAIPGVFDAGEAQHLLETLTFVLTNKQRYAAPYVKPTIENLAPFLREIHRFLNPGGAGVWGWHSLWDLPRLDIWAKVYPNVKWVRPVRHPVECIGSAYSLWHVQQNRTLDVYTEMWVNLMKGLEEFGGLIMRVEDVNAHPERELRRLLEYLDVPDAARLDRLGELYHGQQPNTAKEQGGRNLISADEAAAIWEAAGETARRYGYTDWRSAGNIAPPDVTSAAPMAGSGVAGRAVS